eukprot:CAMPEP_0177538508 /NCGR_PEP_ID=MMETSP0369-20130122/58425_1 /TAXON_ID=447022 ORGANISM="Scrippsiella hangoei-like, Strain SHHI-4" /NCGR_SAMPLE_ID=MMETSP0369 /ASSEMBLY_ACC=CAM_ASM_000364 /LENGTH=34 /DNA_ID= /DNA_START= /DNA_END= /DNA_ORIENTATION=
MAAKWSSRSETVCATSGSPTATWRLEAAPSAPSL